MCFFSEVALRKPTFKLFLLVVVKVEGFSSQSAWLWEVDILFDIDGGVRGIRDKFEYWVPIPEMPKESLIAVKSEIVCTKWDLFSLFHLTRNLPALFQTYLKPRCFAVSFMDK